MIGYSMIQILQVSVSIQNPLLILSRPNNQNMIIYCIKYSLIMPEITPVNNFLDKVKKIGFVMIYYSIHVVMAILLFILIKIPIENLEFKLTKGNISTYLEIILQRDLC